jgi:CubicO group peptidase (beta-lactamase class C family)
MYDGYLDADYDGWYTAPSVAGKMRHMNAHLKPYPWEPGTVVRYRDHDFFVLGIAIDAFLKSMRGPETDAWTVLRNEVLAPIGIAHAPAVRTREPGGDGPVWFNAGYYPTLDDLAKIALLYEDGGAHDGKQLLHRELTLDLLAARNALDKQGDGSISRPRRDDPPAKLYHLGFHYSPYRGSQSQTLHYLPTMSGFGENEVVLFPNHVVAIRTAKVAEVPTGEQAASDDVDATLHAVDRLSPF